MLCSDGSFVSEHGSLTPAEVELTQRQFLEFDVDGDQSISRRDFGEAMGRNDPQWREPQRQAKLDAMYAAVDGDGDGRVSFVEFAAMRVRKKRGVQTPRRLQPPLPPPPPPPPPPPAPAVLRVYLYGCGHGVGLCLDGLNVITELPPGGAAARSGQLRLGDRVVGADGVTLEGNRVLQDVMRPADSHTFDVVRGGTPQHPAHPAPHPHCGPPSSYTQGADGWQTTRMPPMPMPPMHGHQLCSPPPHAAPGFASAGSPSPHSYAAPPPPSGHVPSHHLLAAQTPRLPGMPYAPHAGAAHVAAAQAAAQAAAAAASPYGVAAAQAAAHAAYCAALNPSQLPPHAQQRASTCACAMGYPPYPLTPPTPTAATSTAAAATAAAAASVLPYGAATFRAVDSGYEPLLY